MFTALAPLLWCSLFSFVRSAEWYERGPFYQIFPKSYADSDGDGNGDFRGIAEHVSYLKDLGIEAIWLNPICASPFRDAGYDCSDFVSVNPSFGNMSDFEYLVEVLHENDIRILIDFVPNHSSDEHQWFKDSINKTNGKTDYYVWVDSNGTDTSGNPIAPYGETHWTYNEERGQFYYHAFSTYQPDLNYKNSSVLEEMKEVMRFWLRKGVDGFRVDAAMMLWENSYDEEESGQPPSPPTGSPSFSSNTTLPAFSSDGSTSFSDGPTSFSDEPPSGPPSSANGTSTTSGMSCQPESVEIMKQFNQVLEEDEFKNRTRVNVIEIMGGLSCALDYYDGKNFPFNFQLLDASSSSTSLVSAIQTWMSGMSNGSWPNWQSGNHDTSRVATRFGTDMVDIMNMLVTLLPGLPVTYYGEELGMSDISSSGNSSSDGSFLKDRSGYRNAMQWNNSLNAGFTTNTTNTSEIVNSDYTTVNVESESEDSDSHLNIYKQLVTLHKTLINSSTETLELNTISDHVFAFKRPSHIVVINTNSDEESVNLNESFTDLPDTLYVKIQSQNADFNLGSIQTSSNFTMPSKSGVVFSYEETTTTSDAPKRNCLGFIASLCLLSFILRRL